MESKILLQINTSSNVYSTGVIASQIGKKAIGLGWKSYIMYNSGIKPSDNKSIKIGNKWSNFWHLLLARTFDMQGLGSFLCTLKTIIQIKRIKPDIIHLHNIHDYYLNYPLLFNYLNKTDIPIVWTFHDCWAFTGHCAHFTSVKCSRWREEGCYNCPQARSYSPTLLDFSKRNFNLKKRYFLNNRNLTIVAVSHWLHKQVEQSFFHGTNSLVIGNGVDTDYFKYTPSNIREVYNIGNKTMLLGVASSWTQSKGLYDYFELARRLQENYIVVLIGLNDEQIIEASNHGILGLKSSYEKHNIVKFYSAADISLNLSYQETFGLTTVEALSCGTPGIVYNCTASPELITPDTGVVVTPGCIDDLVEAIHFISAKGKSSYSMKCRERAVENYSTSRNYSDYIKLYNDIINE